MAAYTGYGQDFFDKLKLKPDWLTPSEKARCFATMRGWEFRPPQFFAPSGDPLDERYRNMPAELLVAIPGLSQLLDIDTSTGTVTGGTTAGVAHGQPLVIKKNSVGFTRRSRRRYSLNLSFPEALYIQAGINHDVDFTIRFAYEHATDTAGNPLTQSGGGALPTFLTTEVHPPTTGDDLLTGRITWDFPTLNADPGEFSVENLVFEVNGTSATFTPSHVVDDRGRKWQTSAIEQSDLTGHKIEMVKPDTTEAR